MFQKKFYRFSFPTGNGEMEGNASFPVAFDPTKKYPIIFFIRGGYSNVGALTDCQLELLDAISNEFPDGILFAPDTYVTKSGKINDEFGGKDLSDLISLVKWSENLQFIDSDRRYQIGLSRGGMMAFLLIKNKVRFRATAVIGAISDLKDLQSKRPEVRGVFENLIPNYKENPEDSLKKRSAIHWSEELRNPLIIIHGSADESVPVEQSRKLSKELSKLNIEHRYVEYTGDNHGLFKNLPLALKAIKDWFDKH